MRILDSRRLTGGNLFLSRPGAVLDVAVGDDDRELLVAAWKRFAGRLLDELEWEGESLASRSIDAGVSLAISAPDDGLYTATELNEVAFEAARGWIEGSQRHLLLRAARQLRDEYRGEERPRLRRLLLAAEEHSTPAFLDEESLTLGSGRHSETWDLYELPHPDDLRWPKYKAVPTVLITGTNGKTTTTRLLASVVKAAGKAPGVSSTDWVAVGDDVIDRSDYAGPGGARLILRDKRTEVALLETARGGLLRRGLAVARADVALITNIAADHLGDFGVATVDDLADVKWTVTKALDKRSKLVLNAEDPLLMQRYDSATAPVVLFSLSPRNQSFRRHVENGGVGFTVRRGRIEKQHGKDTIAIVNLKRIPVTFNGTAKHNNANAVAAAAVADALGIEHSRIAEGLVQLSNDDNPGRGNLFTVDGVSVFLDFAHNPAGLAALMPVVEALPANRRALITGQAGDRGDDDIRDFALASSSIQFERVFVKRMDGHARGREEGEVAEIMRDAYVDTGYKRRQISFSKTELDAVKSALRWAKPGDLVLLLSHEQREKTQAYLKARQD